MFDYDANIRLNINDTAALAALKKLEDRIAQLSDPRTAGALKNLTGFSKAKQEFSALKQERAEDLAYRKRKTRQIADELRLSNALELQEGRRIKLQRAGALDVPSRKKAIAKLDKISAANPKNAEIQERVATGLSRILTTQNEINRATNKNIGQKQRIADYNKQIDRLRELGATEGQLRKAQKRKYEFVDAAERRQTSLSDRRELQLKREIKLLGDTQKAARDAATAVTRPGTLSGGARSALSSGPAKSTLGSPKADKARFDFYEKNYKTALAKVFKTEQAYEKQLQANSLNNIKAEEAAELASINRVAAAEKAQNKRINDEVKQSDRLQKAKEAGIAASAKAGGPSSPLPERSVLGSDSSLRKKAEYYERVAKSVKAISSPMRAQSVLGSDSSLRKKAEYYERVAKSVKAISSPMRAQSVLGSDSSLRKKAEYYERVAKSVKAISSPMRAQSVLGSDSSLRKKAEYYERVAKSVKAISSPMRAQSVLGSDSSLRKKAEYYERVAKSVKAISSPMRAQSVLGSDSSLRKKAEYYERVAKSVKAISSPMRAQSVLGSDSSLRKKAEYYERVNKAIKGPSSLLTSGPAKSTLGSPKADKARFDFYEKNYKTALAKVFKTEQAYEKQLQANSLNNIKAEEAAELASINRVAAAEKAQNKRINDEVKQSDRLQKAKEVGKASKGKKGEGFLNFGKGQTNLAAGVGFPLLFGGGPGSVIGGGLGALAGGFGGSIIGGAIGTQLDKLGAAALSTADAFEKLGATASDLIPKLGRGAGEGFGGRAQFLIDEGSSSQVGEILRERFAEVYGDKALKEFEKLAEQNKKFKETWEEIGVELQRLMAGPLGALLKGLQGISNGLSGRGNEGVDERLGLNAKYTELQKRANAITEGGGQLSLAEKTALENARLASAGASPDKQTSLNEDPDKKTAAEQKLIDLVNKKRKIEEAVNADKLAALKQALTARRDELAILNTAAGITRATAELDNTRKELAAERNKILKDTLKITQLEKTEAEQAADLERQRIAQANALAH